MQDYISAIIVDDEQDARDGLESLINQFLPNIKVISKSQNAQNALEIIIDQHPEIIFLDIHMPVNNGFWLASKLQKLKSNICVIFITAYDEYARKAMKFSAFDFLTKPVDTKKLTETVNRYITNKDNYNLKQKLKNLEIFFKQNQLKLNTQYGFVMVLPDEIIYCEKHNDIWNVFLTSGKVEIVYFELDIFIQQLYDKLFIRINRSTIINPNYLENFNISSRTVILSYIIQKYEFKASSAGTRLLSRQ